METRETSDQVLLERLIEPQTRQQAFSQLLSKYQEPIYFFIRRMVYEHEQTDEVLQDAFMKCYRQLSGLNGNNDLRFVLYSSATRRISDFLRNRDPQEWMPRLIVLLKTEGFSFSDIGVMLDRSTESVKNGYQSYERKG